MSPRYKLVYDRKKLKHRIWDKVERKFTNHRVTGKASGKIRVSALNSELKRKSGGKFNLSRAIKKVGIDSFFKKRKNIDL